MKEAMTFNSVSDAIASLDNGGRFYNVLSKPNDGVISQSEVARIAGVFSDKQTTVLFLDMALANLSSQGRESVISSLSADFKVTYDKYKPSWLLPSEASVKGVISSSIVVTGVPTPLRSAKDLAGFVLVPAGKAFVTIPIIDQYDVYEIRDELLSGSFLIAHAKGDRKLPSEKIRVGGILKQLKTHKEEEQGSKKFLEVVYFNGIL